MEAPVLPAPAGQLLDDPYGPALAALDEAGVRWCVLRRSAARPPHDLDVLVSPGDRRRLDAVLAPAGFVRVPRRSRHRSYVAYDAAAGRWVVLDVVCGLVYGRGGRFEIRAVDEVLARAIRRHRTPFLRGDDRIWTLLLHELLDRPEMRPHVEADLRELAHAVEPDGPLAEAVAGAVGSRSAAELLDLVRRGEWERLRAALEPLVRPPSAARRLLRRATRPAPALSRRGFAVAIIGPDGAGKSTLAHGLADHAVLPARIVYMGMQRGASVPGKTWQPTSPQRTRGRRPLHRRVLRQGRQIGRFAARSLGARRHRALGRLVVFDRLGWDAHVNWKRTTGFGPRLRIRLIEALSLRPDLVLLLDAPGAAMYERKREHSAELLEERRRRYLELAARRPGVVVLDATLPQDEVRRRATAAVWRAVRDRGGLYRRPWRPRRTS